MISQIKGILNQWFKNRGEKSNPQILSPHQIYILPSKFGWVFLVVVLTISTGAVNYQLNSAYFLVFLLICVGFLTMLLSHQNMKHIKIRCLDIKDSEEGKPVVVILIAQENHRDRYGLYFNTHDCKSVYTEKISPSGQKIDIPLTNSRRGKFKLPRIQIYSYFPFGLFKVWSYLYFDKHYYIYPKAQSPGYWPTETTATAQDINHTDRIGGDEHQDLQTVDNPWVQTSRIAWKISARDKNWYLKKMYSPSNQSWVFNISEIEEGDVEAKLQALSFWIQTAEMEKQPYKLRLEYFSSNLGLGEKHMKYCLRQLAVF